MRFLLITYHRRHRCVFREFNITPYTNAINTVLSFSNTCAEMHYYLWPDSTGFYNGRDALAQAFRQIKTLQS